MESLYLLPKNTVTWPTLTGGKGIKTENKAESETQTRTLFCWRSGCNAGGKRCILGLGFGVNARHQLVTNVVEILHILDYVEHAEQYFHSLTKYANEQNVCHKICHSVDVGHLHV